MASQKYLEARKAEQLERIEAKLDLIMVKLGIKLESEPEAAPEPVADTPADGEPEAKPAKAKK